MTAGGEEAVALPPFPVDDSTLAAIEHAMGGALTYDRPDALIDEVRRLRATTTQETR